MKELQAASDSRDVRGSPHLKHDALRQSIIEELEALCVPGERWLDIGAGHGAFVAVPLERGMSAVATEMSEPALHEFQRRLGAAGLEVRAASDEDTGVLPGERFRVISMISVIHHIPDYGSAIESLVGDHLEPGGAFVCFQDPLYYPRLGRLRHGLHRALYYTWRLAQGDVGGGIGRVLRRRRRVFDETTAHDMVEYHVVRDGVDEEAILALLRPHFADVRLVPYWSSQGGGAHRLGHLLRLRNTFGIVATGKR